MNATHRDIKPHSEIATLSRTYTRDELDTTFTLDTVAAVVGMSPGFVRKVLGHGAKRVSLEETLHLLEQDAFHETFIPRSRVPRYLLSLPPALESCDRLDLGAEHTLYHGNAKDLLPRMPARSIRCIVTSSPYWATRIYDTHFPVDWSDGESCPYGHEQTPEGFIRHTVELLFLAKPVLTLDGSVWWNLMDTYNTRTQIRSNASETLKAMQGKDSRSWADYACRRYSAGHAYLSDGEQCLIPTRIAERASRIGYWVKSVISWKKEGSLPETVSTRVTREVEHILHLSLQRSPYFNKDAFRTLPPPLGGRNARYEFDKVTDVWCLPTANGRDGHGAQFPLALPGRCLALTSEPSDVVLDPFVGSGTTIVAANALGRRSVGFDVDKDYLETARKRLAKDTQISLPGLTIPQP
jgi:DNA modification methylase